MKVTIEYDPVEGAAALALALNGQDLQRAVVDMLEWLRRIGKYQGKTTLEADEVRATFLATLAEYNVERLIE